MQCIRVHGRASEMHWKSVEFDMQGHTLTLSHHCNQSKAKLCSEEAPALTFEGDFSNWKNADKVGDILNPNGSIGFHNV